MNVTQDKVNAFGNRREQAVGVVDEIDATGVLNRSIKGRDRAAASGAEVCDYLSRW